MTLGSSTPGDSIREHLPRRVIIRRRTVFEASRQTGKRYTSRCFLLNILPRESVKQKSADPTSLVAFLTPKRLGPAPVRNKLRRRMREIYRRHVATLPLEKTDSLPPYQIWVARPGAVELDFASLKQGMLELWKRVK